LFVTKSEKGWVGPENIAGLAKIGQIATIETKPLTTQATFDSLAGSVAQGRNTGIG
jgi:hypothetical protein